MNQILAIGQAIGLTVLLATNSGSQTPAPPPTPDERLADFARDSMDQQVRQNEAIARQSEAILGETQKLAEAAQTLVEKDAEARREMVAAQRELQKKLVQQQAAVSTERDRLEEERRDLAQQLGRHPIVAAAIHNFGSLLACLLPLLVCIYLLYRMKGDNDSDQALGELLVQELTADRPLLLPGPPLRGPLALEYQDGRDRLDDPPRVDESEPAVPC